MSHRRPSPAIPEQYLQRPEAYDPSVARVIVLRVSNGETLTAICKDRDYPLRSTVEDWREQNPEFDALMKKAELRQAAYLFEEMIDTAAGPDPLRARVMLEARKLRAERMDPKRFGPRTTEAPAAAPEASDDVGELRRAVERVASRVTTH